MITGSGFAKAGEAVAKLIAALLVLLMFTLPLAIWKLIELLVWFFSHLRWE